MDGVSHDWRPWSITVVFDPQDTPAPYLGVVYTSGVDEYHRRPISAAQSRTTVIEFAELCWAASGQPPTTHVAVQSLDLEGRLRVRNCVSELVRALLHDMARVVRSSIPMPTEATPTTRRLVWEKGYDACFGEGR